MDYQPVKQDTFFRRKKKTKLVLIISVILVIIIAILLGVYLVMKGKRDSEKKSTYLESAKLILENMDPNVDPCDDFYQFACGNFLKTATIPQSKTSVDSFATLAKVIDEQTHVILNEPIKPDDAKPLQLVKKLYTACMNETDIELRAVDTLKNILKKLGGWPVLEGSNWDASKFNWMDTLLSFKEIGMPYGQLMDFAVELDNKDSSRRVLTIDQPFVAFEQVKRGPRGNPVLDASHRFMTDIAVAFGAQPNLADKEMEDVLQFEMALAKIMVPQEQRRDLEEEYHPFTIKEMESKYPSLPGYRFYKRLVAPSKIGYENNVIVYLPEYLDRLEKLIRSTPKRTLANFIFYKAAGSMITYSNKRLRQIQLEFTNATMGVRSSQPRNEQCTSIASRLDVAIGALYVREFFNKEAKTNTEQIVKNIEDQFRKTLENVDWMDQSTKKAAIEKLEAMGKFIGYPNELMDDSQLAQYYRDLEINSDNYVEVVLNISKFQTETEMMLLSQPVIKSDWRSRSSVAVVNAFYDLNANAIQVPAGILQGVFFNVKRPQYLNYGGIGYITGHEFTHGFDDEGSQMDKNGNLKEWWSEDIKKAYDKKAQCIVEQYSKLVVPEVNMTINGINTQGENIADNGGIKLAYLAYQEWVSQNGAEEKLPNLKYTPNQLYWIGAANVWCSKMLPKAMKQDLISEVHPPDRFRINVPFANSKYFAKDFNCPKGSNMNPLETCTVW